MDNDTVIFRVTRAELIESGTLIDLSTGAYSGLPKLLGLKYPVAITAEAYMDTVTNSPGGDVPSEILARRWRVLMAARRAMYGSPPGTDECPFVVRVENENGT